MKISITQHFIIETLINAKSTFHNFANTERAVDLQIRKKMNTVEFALELNFTKNSSNPSENSILQHFWKMFVIIFFDKNTKKNICNFIEKKIFFHLKLYEKNSWNQFQPDFYGIVAHYANKKEFVCKKIFWKWKCQNLYEE